ncbi:MAG: hypothetical protein IJC74_00795 [Clostridia bacterium]|nr:hypothetical protein [Clostridia bacterium]
MDTTKKLEIEIPASVFDYLSEENEDVNKVINDILNDYINNKKKKEEEMINGYQEMGMINLGLANLGIQSDNEALDIGELYLTESE